MNWRLASNFPLTVNIMIPEGKRPDAPFANWFNIVTQALPSHFPGFIDSRWIHPPGQQI